jgi:hypothetical protein
MLLPLALAALAVALAVTWVRCERERRETARVIADLREEVRELSMRLDVAEHDAVAASAQAEVAERVLLEKGYADADDLESARLQLEGESLAGAARGRDGEVH